MVVRPIAELDRLAARQHGVFSRGQAITLGLTRAQISYRLEQHRWVRLSSGVYALASAAVSWERQLMAALLTHPRSVVGGRSAAVLHEFAGFRRGRPEILAPFSGNSRCSLARVVRSRHFDSVATSIIAGFHCTTIPETILTLSLRESPSTIERVLDDQLAAEKLKVDDFGPILERLEFARQPGLPALRRALSRRSADAYQPPTSLLEKLLYQLLTRPELPPHDRQLPIAYERLDATVDAYIPEWSIIVEADGRRWHTRVADFERDRARDNAAAAAGLVVVRFTYRMLKDNPKECLDTLVNAGRWRRPA